MFKLKYFIFFIVCFSATNIYAQKYIQISTEKQQESKDIIVYEFFGMVAHIVLTWSLRWIE